MKMKKSTKSDKVMKLAEKAGFVIWDECDWAEDRVGKVDWASEYDNELVKFYNLVRKDLLKELEENGRLQPG